MDRNRVGNDRDRYAERKGQIEIEMPKIDRN